MDVFDVIYALGLSGVIALLAKRKRRDHWEWGLISVLPIVLFGFDMFLLFVILMLFIRPRCPKCGHSIPLSLVRQQNCPACHYHGRLGLLNTSLQDRLNGLTTLGQRKYRSRRRSKMRRVYSR